MIDIAPYVQTIERINKTRNAEPWIVADFDMATGKLVGHDCVAFANEKLRDLIAAGVPPTAVKLVALMTRWGQGHVVVEIDGDYHGREMHVILDNRIPFPVTREQLEQNGDMFNVRVISTAMEGQFVRPLLKLSGPACTAESPARAEPEGQTWSECSFQMTAQMTVEATPAPEPARPPQDMVADNTPDAVPAPVAVAVAVTDDQATVHQAAVEVTRASIVDHARKSRLHSRAHRTHHA